MRVVIDDVSKTYTDGRGRPVPALAGVSVTVEAEEFVALVGPSGCGKSTLLSIVAGLLAPSEGAIYIDGPADAPATTAMVFQEFALFPWRTVQRNVEFGLEERGVARAERSRRARRYIELTGLAGFEHRYPHELSGGMRQRVGIARALAVEPAVLLMDEPFSALDAQTRWLMQEELLAVWEQTRKTILYVTHNIQEAVYLADRVIVLSRRPGHVLADVPIELKRPRTEAMMGEPAFIHATERIWALIKTEAREALADLALRAPARPDTALP